MNQSQESSGEHACPSVFPVHSNTSGNFFMLLRGFRNFAKRVKYLSFRTRNFLKGH